MNVRTPDQEALFHASGEVEITGRLECFLYLLMRDHLPPGQVAELLKGTGENCNYTNGWLAQYAAHMAHELRKSTSAEVVCPMCRAAVERGYSRRPEELPVCPSCRDSRKVRLDQIRPGSIAGYPCPNGCFKGYDPKMPDRPCHTCNDPRWAQRGV